MLKRRHYILVAAGILVLIAAVALWLRRSRLRDHPVVAVIPETTAEELWECEHAGVVAALAGTNWSIYWNGPSSEEQVAQQIALVQHIDAIHASALILAPDHPLALTTVVRHVLAEGIPTVIVATELPLYPQNNLAFVLNDDDAAGRMAADHVSQLLHGQGSVALLGDNPDVRSSTMRAKVFAETLSLDYPGIRLVAQPRGSFRLGEAEQQTEDVLRANPHLGAIVSIGIIQTRGTLLALRSRKEKGNVPLISFDQDLDLMYSLRHDEINAVVIQNTYRMGQLAMQMVDGTRRGISMPPITRVAPMLVTRGNIDTQEVQQALSVDWRAR